jgi:outer membrane beta-barrel protein
MWKATLLLACAASNLNCYAAEKSQRRIVALNRVETETVAPTVIQNRFFTKQYRVEAGASFGSLLNESYSKTQSVGARAGLFFTEKLGAEYNFVNFRSDDSVDLVALRSQEICIEKECKSLEPSFIRLNKMHQIQAVTAPIYGKINLLDALILYSDLTLSAGMAQVQTTQGTKWAFTPAIGQRFYFSKSFSLRVDVTDIYLKEAHEYQGKKRENWRHNWMAQAGLSVFLNSGGQ